MCVELWKPVEILCLKFFWANHCYASQHIPEFGRLKQEVCKFEISWVYTFSSLLAWATTEWSCPKKCSHSFRKEHTHTHTYNQIVWEIASSSMLVSLFICLSKITQEFQFLWIIDACYSLFSLYGSHSNEYNVVFTCISLWLLTNSFSSFEWIIL